MFRKLLNSNRDMFLVIWVVGILLVLFSPIPPVVQFEGYHHHYEVVVLLSNSRNAN